MSARAVNMEENVFRDQDDVYALMEAFGGAMNTIGGNPGCADHQNVTQQAIDRLAFILGVNCFAKAEEGKFTGYGEIVMFNAPASLSGIQSLIAGSPVEFVPPMDNGGKYAEVTRKDESDTPDWSGRSGG